MQHSRYSTESGEKVCVIVCSFFKCLPEVYCRTKVKKVTDTTTQQLQKSLKKILTQEKLLTQAKTWN